MLIALPVALTLVAGAVIVVTLSGQGRNDASADSARPPGGRPPAARPPAGPPNGQGAVPKGFRRYEDRDGYSLLVPKSWGKPQRKRTGVFFFAPDDNRRYVQIAASDRPAADASSAWRKLEKAKKPTLPDYRRIRLEKIGYPGASTAADWEFTWTGETARMHILDRTFVLGKRGYAVLISAPDNKWKRTYKQLQPVLSSLRPA